MTMQGCYSNVIGWRHIFSHSKGLLYHVMFQCSWNLRELTRSGLHFSSQTSQWQTPSPCLGNGSVSFLCRTPLVGSRKYAHVQAPRCVEHIRAVSSQPRDSVSVRVAHRDNVQGRVGQFIPCEWTQLARRILDPHCKYSLEPFKMTVKLVTGCERFCAGNLLMVRGFPRKPCFLKWAALSCTRERAAKNHTA